MQGLRYCSWAPDILLRDPIARRMNAEQFGGYCSLLIEAWFDPEGSLPLDDEELRILSRLDGEAWPRNKNVILKLFTIDNGRIYSPIVDEARERALKRSEAGKTAAEARLNYRKLKLENSTNVEQTSTNVEQTLTDVEQEKQIRTTKEKEKGIEKGIEKNNSIVSRNRETRASLVQDFERFWVAWKALGPKTTLNKVNAKNAFEKAVRRGATADDIISAVGVYDKYLSYREKNGRPESREFIPMAETWLNQDRFTSEYPAVIFETVITEPIAGKDFYWGNVIENENEYVARFEILADGTRTENRFDPEKWKNRK